MWNIMNVVPFLCGEGTRWSSFFRETSWNTLSGNFELTDGDPGKTNISKQSYFIHAKSREIISCFWMLHIFRIKPSKKQKQKKFTQQQIWKMYFKMELFFISLYLYTYVKTFTYMFVYLFINTFLIFNLFILSISSCISVTDWAFLVGLVCTGFSAGSFFWCSSSKHSSDI